MILQVAKRIANIRLTLASSDEECTEIGNCITVKILLY